MMLRMLAPVAAVALIGWMAAPVVAQAQTPSPAAAGSTSMGSAYDANRTSWIPYTRSGYMGLNAGRSDFGNSCGALALRCDDGDTSGHLYLGGYFNPYLGAEIGYLHLGDVQRAGGRTNAHGLNLSLVGRAPLSQRFSLYGKLGTTYGRTRVNAAAGSGVVSGRESGWGPAYALGASYDITNNWSAVLEWNRQRFDFAGGSRDWVRTTSVGVRYHF